MRECAHCHARLEDDDVFCNMCGKPLDVVQPAPPLAAPTAAAPPPVTSAASASEPSATPPRRSRKGLIIGVIVVLVVLLGCCVAGGAWLLLRGDGLNLGIATTSVSAADDYSLAFEEAYEDPTFGPWDTRSATALVMEPAEGSPEADDVVYAVVIWFHGTPGSLDELFDEWRYPQGVEDQISSMVSDREWDAADFAIDGDIDPGEDLAVWVEVLLYEDHSLTSHERDSIASRLTTWAMENPPK